MVETVIANPADLCITFYETQISAVPVICDLWSDLRDQGQYWYLSQR